MTRSATAARASPARDGELRVLILEDVPADAELTARALKPSRDQRFGQGGRYEEVIRRGADRIVA